MGKKKRGQMRKDLRLKLESKIDGDTILQGPDKELLKKLTSNKKADRENRDSVREKLTEQQESLKVKNRLWRTRKITGTTDSGTPQNMKPTTIFRGRLEITGSKYVFKHNLSWKRTTAFITNSPRALVLGRSTSGRTASSALRAGKITGRANAISNGVTGMYGGAMKTKSGDSLQVISGVIDIVSSITAFCGPYGKAASAVLGIFNTFLGILGANGPSPMEQMTKLINKQTKQIKGMIEDQTDILLRALNQLGDQQVKLTQRVISKIDTTSFEDMVNEISGTELTLKVKKRHIEEHRDSCINNWSEISVEADLQKVVFQMGKLASLTNTFCYSRPNLDFCGRLIFLYTTLAISRNYVLADTIALIRRSEFPNQEYKLNGLLAELEVMMQGDKEFLKPLVNANSSVEDPFCHVTCALQGIENKLQENNKWIWQNNDQKFTASNMTLTDEHKDFMCKYFAQLNLPCKLPETTYNKDECTKCYQKDVVCTQTTNILKADSKTKRKWTEYKKNEDGICEQCPQEEWICDCEMKWEGTSPSCCLDLLSNSYNCKCSGDTPHTLALCRNDAGCSALDPYPSMSPVKFGVQCTTGRKVLCSSCTEEHAKACGPGTNANKQIKNACIKH